MKTTSKQVVKLFLVISLFCSVAFAEGDMGSGTKTCTPNCFVGTPTAPTDSEPSSEPGTTTVDPDQTESEDSILTFIQEYLLSIF